MVPVQTVKCAVSDLGARAVALVEDSLLQIKSQSLVVPLFGMLRVSRRLCQRDLGDHLESSHEPRCPFSNSEDVASSRVKLVLDLCVELLFDLGDLNFQIKRRRNLDKLHKLDVLDLHSNARHSECRLLFRTYLEDFSCGGPIFFEFASSDFSQNVVETGQNNNLLCGCFAQNFTTRAGPPAAVFPKTRGFFFLSSDTHRRSPKSSNSRP